MLVLSRVDYWVGLDVEPCMVGVCFAVVVDLALYYVDVSVYGVIA